MKSRKLAEFLKSRLPFAVVAVAVLALLAAALACNRGIEDAPAPTHEPKPASTGWYFATPTNEEFSRDLEDLRTRRAVSGDNGEKRGSRSSVIIPPTPVPRSTAEAEAWDALLEGTAMYFPTSDKVIHLPEGVTVGWWIPAVNCGVWCPYAPVYVLHNGEATVHLDARGNVISPLPRPSDSDNPDAFPFLKEE